MPKDYTSSPSNQPNRGYAAHADSRITDGTKDALTGNANQTDLRKYASGAKSSGNVPPYECLTETLLKRAALRMQLGMHYGKHNWKKGIRDKSFILDRLNHAVEHLMKALHEIDYDEKMGDDDLAAVVVNCMFAMEYQNHLQDIPSQHTTEPVTLQTRPLIKSRYEGSELD